jgi:hypothetical protein
VSSRYELPRQPRRTEDEWHALARAAVVALLEREYSVTPVEMEAKLSDRVFDPNICPTPINPHHLTTARQALLEDGQIEPTTAITKAKDDSGAPQRVTTWSLCRAPGRKTAIAKAAERKRALTSRWLSWGRRHLLGDAGESALAAALTKAPDLVEITGRTTRVLGVSVDEVDNTAVYVARDEESLLVAVQVIFEVKNTREYYYASADDVAVFLRKAAVVQAARPSQLVLPVFLCRRWQFTLWEAGQIAGFLPAMVYQQVVKKDPELRLDEWRSRFNEVQSELFPDLRALADAGSTTNRHQGIVNTLIPQRALVYARLWRENHSDYLPT